MLTYTVLDYNRPEESELCLKSIRLHSKLDYNIVFLSNGGDQDYAFDFYKKGLIDKLILRKKNSGCGLGTRECFNDFNIETDYCVYVQSDQFMIRDFTHDEASSYKALLFNKQFFYIDLAGNQGNGNPSERALMINKTDYQKIPNSIGGPGPYASHKWTEQSLQEYMKENNLKFLTPSVLFLDNGKNSIREYPCGGKLKMETDTKRVYILSPIAKRIDFPNITLTDYEWSEILEGKWINGTIPINHRNSSFLYWKQPWSVRDLE